jgi:hypothetical protein
LLWALSPSVFTPSRRRRRKKLISSSVNISGNLPTSPSTCTYKHTHTQREREREKKERERRAEGGDEYLTNEAIRTTQSGIDLRANSYQSSRDLQKSEWQHGESEEEDRERAANLRSFSSANRETIREKIGTHFTFPCAHEMPRTTRQTGGDSGTERAWVRLW